MAQGQTNWLKIVGIGCGVLALIGLLCGFGIFMCAQKIMEAKPHAHAFLGELRSGDYQSAYQRMEGSYQATNDLAAFQARVQAMPGLTTSTDATFTSINVNNATHDLTGGLDTPTGPMQIRMLIMKSGDNFYVSNVFVSGVPLR